LLTLIVRSLINICNVLVADREGWWNYAMSAWMDGHEVMAGNDLEWIPLSKPAHQQHQVHTDSAAP
jgi:hypothetical protein